MDQELTGDLNLRLFVLVHQVRDAILKARENEVYPHGISAIQAAVLDIIRLMGNRATPGELSRWLFRKPHSVSGILDRMEARGLIRRVRDLERKNLVRLELTEAGERIFRQAHPKASLNRIFATFTEEERLLPAALLKRLRRSALREINLRYDPPIP